MRRISKDEETLGGQGREKNPKKRVGGGVLVSKKRVGGFLVFISLL